jgi:vesicle coat complex subunit
MEQEPTNTLAAELLAMAKTDRAMRDTYQTTDVWDGSVDEANTARLREIIEKQGWPTKTLVGTEAASAAWLIAQHADKEPAFQEKCLELMKQLPENEVTLWSIAFLEDRIRVNTNRPQLYGTQFGARNGSFGPLPIEDEAHLEERRIAMGLDSFEEYSREMHEMYEEQQASLAEHN